MDRRLPLVGIQDVQPDEQRDCHYSYGSEYALKNNKSWRVGICLLREPHVDDRVKAL